MPNPMVVTTIPFHADGELAEELWQEGASLREKWGDPWIVLNHEPPACTSVGGSHGNHDVLNNVLRFSPTYLLGGHIHNVPYHGGFASKVGSSWCFNAGYPPSTKAAIAPFPNHIIIFEGKATWRATGLAGVVQQSIDLA